MAYTRGFEHRKHTTTEQKINKRARDKRTSYHWVPNNGHGYLQLPLLNISGVFHLFGTRLLERASLQKDYTPIFLHQVHQDRIIRIVSDGTVKEDDGDGLTTNTLNQLIAVSTADCVPILLFDPVKKAAAALHAGWRGSILNISGKGVRNLVLNYGSDPKDVVAGIGPSIGPCCFEVGLDVVSAAEEKTSYGERVLQKKGNGKWRLDLVKLNSLQLMDAGIPPDQIQAAGLCTACLPNLFTSFRRDKKIVGSMMSGIMLL